MKVFLILLFISSFAYSELRIPYNLSASDRNTALEILGFGTAMKILGDPFPLGGYSGIEFGLSTSILSSSDISRLGNRSTSQTETSYQMLTAGKGLYKDVDILVGFAFAGQTENIQSFGMQLRWGFFQAEYLPVYASLVFSSANTRFNNFIVTNNYNYDLILGFKEGDVTLYFGGGVLTAQGEFSGGNGGITNSGLTEYNSLVGNHFLAGINIKFSNLFTAFELDRNSAPTYSAKLGYRF